uniref:Uncharacterized protein n=1 Tax=Nelumbo nucifera TaxID=4432 RepID=A0A822XIG0_NELNU|nr:TPA_asm: hypothetical protein HUJ06_022777 [Nelumbo nucifera]
MKKYVNPSINGATGKECNPVSTKTPQSQSICFTNDAKFVDLDPGHSFKAIQEQDSNPNLYPYTPSWCVDLPSLIDGSLRFLGQPNQTGSSSTLQRLTVRPAMSRSS